LSRVYYSIIEAAELEKKLAQKSAAEKLLAENVQELQKNVESLDMEIKRCRDLRHNLHTVTDPRKVRSEISFSRIIEIY